MIAFNKASFRKSSPRFQLFPDKKVECTRDREIAFNNASFRKSSLELYTKTQILSRNCPGWGGACFYTARVRKVSPISSENVSRVSQSVENIWTQIFRSSGKSTFKDFFCPNKIPTVSRCTLRENQTANVLHKEGDRRRHRGKSFDNHTSGILN